MLPLNLNIVNVSQKHSLKEFHLLFLANYLEDIYAFVT